MAEIRHYENVTNSRIKRQGINGYSVNVICGCSRTCGGFAYIREHVPAPEKPKAPPKPKKKGSREYREWLKLHAS